MYVREKLINKPTRQQAQLPLFISLQVLWASQAVGLPRGVQPGGAAPAAESDYDQAAQS